MSEEIINKLDKLAEFRETDRAIHEEFEKKKEALLKPLKGKIEKLESQYAKIFGSSAEKVANLESQIREGVLRLGESAKGKDLHAVYSKGRTSWDSKGLDGYAVANPKILAFRSQGLPSVSIREVQK